MYCSSGDFFPLLVFVFLFVPFVARLYVRLGISYLRVCLSVILYEIFYRKEMEYTTRSNSNSQSPLARVLEHSNHMLARGKETSYRETKLLFLPGGGYSLPLKNEKKDKR